MHLRYVNAYKKEDNPNARVEPVYLKILLQAKLLVQSSSDPCDRATIKCIRMAFYFLLCHGEYANATGDDQQLLQLHDVQFKVRHRNLPKLLLATTDNLCDATLV